MAQSTTQEAKDKTKAAAAKTEEVIDDSAITTSIKTKLLADKKTSAIEIGVERLHQRRRHAQRQK